MSLWSPHAKGKVRWCQMCCGRFMKSFTCFTSIFEKIPWRSSSSLPSSRSSKLDGRDMLEAGQFKVSHGVALSQIGRRMSLKRLKPLWSFVYYEILWDSMASVCQVQIRVIRWWCTNWTGTDDGLGGYRHRRSRGRSEHGTLDHWRWGYSTI
jgi:hypothetical protein